MAGWMFAESVQLVFKTRLSKQMKMPNYGSPEPGLTIAHFSVQRRLSEASGVLRRQSCRGQRRRRLWPREQIQVSVKLLRMSFSPLGTSCVAGCFLGLAAELGSAPRAAVPGCSTAVPAQAPGFHNFMFLKDAFVSCRYSWERGHAAPRRSDESRWR